MTTDFNFPDCTLPEMLRQTAQRFARHTAVAFNGQTLDFATFDRLSDRVAAGLHAQGLGKGDRIGLYCINSDAFALAYVGIVKAGATVVPINLLLNPREVIYILKDAGVRALIYHEAFMDALTMIRAELPAVSLYVGIGGKPLPAGDTPWSDLLNAAGAPPAVSFDPAEDLVVIIYTSGTTGRPKGAMLTHRNLIANTCSIKAALELESGKDVLLVVLPMFHAFAATVGMLFPLLHGCTIVPLPRFEPELVANAIETLGVTIFPAVPSMYNVMLRLGHDFTSKLSSLRFAVSGGAAMPLEVMNRFETRFDRLIYEGDGPTECSPVTCVNPIHGLRKPGSVGLAVPGVDMCIMDESGKELPRGTIGEICVRGPNVMKGYWNQPDETRKAFFGEWFRTGDLGTEDEDGYFFIVDRIKDMIIVNGMNVYPRMIEEVLYQHPAIHEAAVVGEPHKLHGEIPVAYVSLEEAGELTAPQVQAFCRQHLGRHEIPRRVLFLPALPKTPTGKILKRELRKQGELERGIDIKEIEKKVTRQGQVVPQEPLP